MTISTANLHEQYRIADMSYLDGPDASPIYKTMADIIKCNKLTSIVDVGCRVGTLNKFLTNYEYNYYGFDTSREPIEKAMTVYPEHQFCVRSWKYLIRPMFDVDVVVFSSVLIYDNKPHEMFNRICDFYKPKHAIVHEVTNSNTEDLQYTDLDYFSKNYKCNIINLDLNIQVGKRTIIDVEY